MADVVILGNGPAGISAALYTTRAGLKTVVVGRDAGALLKAHKIENYYGFPEPVSGEELVRRGIAQAERLGAKVVTDEVVGVAYDGNFAAQAKSRDYRAPVMILATGSSRTAPKIPGVDRLEGRGVSYCAVCDAFFYRKKDVAVLGDGEYALHEAAELLPVVGSVTLLTNGREPSVDISGEIKVVKTPISSLEGDPVLNRVEFLNGDSIAVSGFFVALGVAGSTDLARKIGAEVKGNSIVVDREMQTSVPGLFAAGDCTGGLLQVSKAVYEGAQAASGAIQYFRKTKASV